MQPSYHDEEMDVSAESLQKERGLSPELTHEALGLLETDPSGERLKTLLLALHPADLAEFVALVPADQRTSLVSIIRGNFDAEMLTYLDPGIRELVIADLGTEVAADAIAELHTDDAVEVMSDLNREEQKEILQAIPDEVARAEVEEGLAYPDSSAGRLMRREMVTAPETWTVGDTIDFLRSHSTHLPDEFHAIFIVDPSFKLVGSVPLSRVMQNARETNITEIMNTGLHPFKPETDQEEVAFKFRKYGLIESPVVNASERLVGVITVDDVVHVMEEEEEEDFLRQGGITQQDLHANLLQTVLRRIPWLLVNLLTAFVSSRVIDAFEGQISKLVTLAVLMPIVASVGGNAGTQAVTVAIRGLITRDLQPANARAFFRKELRIGVLNGVCIALVSSIGLWFLYRDFMLSLVFGLAILGNLIVAGAAGSLMPMMLHRLKLDPAVASSVFLTMTTDCMGFLLFLGLASIFLI